jgi:hypothetical protein
MIETQAGAIIFSAAGWRLAAKFTSAQDKENLGGLSLAPNGWPER